MSVSATTRPKRPGESDDVDYHFVDDAEFDGMIEAATSSNGRTCSAIATAPPRRR